ncbi:MAG: alkaline phosphatase family protein [Candidatus Kapabacteria bacterium]|nr:alkaline phosphatase family protein [Candidatus Kapabacteria bacterium]
MRKLVILLIIVFSFVQIKAQKELLMSGPMLGYSEMREVLIWVQTKQEAEVKFEYWKQGDNVKYFSETKRTSPIDGFTAKIKLSNLEPGTNYDYSLYINNKRINFNYPLKFQTQKLWQYREEPPSVKIAMGSCAYINDSLYDRPGKPYGGEYKIFNSIYSKKPDIMLWLGDNIYYREVDWFSRSGMIYRNSHSRAIPELQPLLASVHHYAIWDDHDYGPNNSDRSFRNKNEALDVFQLFWGNPTYGFYDEKCAVTMFKWADIDFFLLDNRWFRSSNNRKFSEKEILGNKQIDWLINALTFSEARFKIIIIGGQVLNPVANYENYSTFPEEQSYLINSISKENIKGVIFISGDRHFSELTSLPREGTYPLLDFTVSPLTSGPFTDACSKENNYLRVPGTCYDKRNFGMIEITGKRTERTLKFLLFDTDGNRIWEKSYSDKDLGW